MCLIERAFFPGPFPWWDGGAHAPGANALHGCALAAPVKAGRLSAARDAGRLDGP